MAFTSFGLVDASVREMATALSAKYKDALAARIEPWALKFCGMTSTSALRQKFPIDLTIVNGFREWVGERKHEDAELTSFFIDSKPFERTIDVPLNVAKSGQFDQYINKIPLVVNAAHMMPNRLMATMLGKGDTAAFNCFDGKPLFSATHPVDLRGKIATTYSNLIANTPFTVANYAKVKRLIRSLTAPDGQTNLGLVVTDVLGAPFMEEVFDAVFKKSVIANAAGTAAETNIYYGGNGAKSTIGPELAGNGDADGTWYALAMNIPGIVPVEQQWADGGAPDIKLLGDGSEYCTENDKIGVFAKLFGNAGPAIPFTIFKMLPT